MMHTAQQLLIERIREKLAGEPVLREVSMFGGHSFMVNEKLLVGALKEGALLVHVAPANHTELLLSPGAGQAEMGTGRSMGPGWIQVDAASLEKDEALASWLGTALEFNRALTGGGR
ncbi:TfoX/Sxy family protein [Glutamicibacter sp. AOP12-B1-11]|uniref:TfoX/Sxy family protein n=1 Tax=unclassified Glutamicibacter TaxID=2627139 RepID=UPI004033562E